MPSAQTYQRALAHCLQGRADQAEGLCREILQQDRRHADALGLLGFIALQRGRAQEARQWLAASLLSNPRQPAAHLNLANALLQQGEAEQALHSCERALALKPDYPEALNNRGTALLHLQRPAEALASYERALRAGPGAALSHNNRGNALMQLRRHEEALASYERALALQPGLAQAMLGRATVLRELERPEEALAACRELLARHGDHALAHSLCAALSQRLHGSEAALRGLDEAVRLCPQSPLLHHERANLLFQSERVAEALLSYEVAARLAPADADIAYNRAGALLVTGQLEAALAGYDGALGLRHGFAKAHCGRGHALYRMQRLQEALAAYERALQIQPDYADALSGMSDALRELGRLEQALAAAEQALRLGPDTLRALRSRARILLGLQRPEDAAAGFERLRQLEGDRTSDYSLGMMLHARLLCCDWRDYDTLIAAIAAAVQSGERATLPSLFSVVSDSPAAQLRCAQRFVADNWSAAAQPRRSVPTYRHERLRVAYVSADFREHPVSQLLLRTIEAHDRSRFEVLGVSLRPEHDSELGQRIKGAFDRFIDVSTRTDAEVVALLRALETDIAVDLNGYTDGFRAGIFAGRAAPVQVNFLGYPGTLGAPYYDFIVADRQVIPPQEQIHYAERVMYLPDCYLPAGADRHGAGAAPTRVECGLPESGFVFCCFNGVHKISPGMFGLWMRILLAVEGSVLWLAAQRPTAIANLRREAQVRGVDSARLIFAPRAARLSDHLARYALADLFLDTAPYNAHTTASDALWSGLPLLTLQGRAFAGRVAASLLFALGLDELAAPSADAYQTLAVQLATTPQLLSGLRERLARARDGSTLFQPVSYCRKLEAAFRQMRAETAPPPSA